MKQTPVRIRVAVATASLVHPDMTLDGLAERTEAALRAAYPHATIEVSKATVSNGAELRVYEDGGEYGPIEITDELAAMDVRHVVGRAWEAYADEVSRAEAAALLGPAPADDVAAAEAAELQAGVARLLALPAGHPDRAEARALFAAQAGLGVGASPPSAPGPGPKTPQPTTSVWRMSLQHTVPVVRVMKQRAEVEVRTDVFVRAAGSAQAVRAALAQWETSSMAEQLAAAAVEWRDVEERAGPVAVDSGCMHITSVVQIDAREAAMIARRTGAPMLDATGAGEPRLVDGWGELGAAAEQEPDARG
jgi:hypothetical protein